MSARVSQYLREVFGGGCELPGHARHLAEVLGHYANTDGEAWCSVATIARRMGVTPATVRRARRLCAEAGVFTVDLSAGGRPGATNVYRFPVVAFVHTSRAGARGQGAEPRAPARETPRASARDPARQRATKIQEGSIEVARYPPVGDVGALWRAAADDERRANMRATGGPHG